MVTLLSQYDRKARKSHKCTGCNCVIEKGWSYQVQNLAEDGKAYTWKSCEKCQYCFDELIDDPEEVCAGDIREEHQYIPEEIRADLTGGYPDNKDGW